MTTRKSNRFIAVVTAFVMLITMFSVALVQRSNAEDRSLVKVNAGEMFLVPATGVSYGIEAVGVYRDTEKDNWFVADTSTYDEIPDVTIDVTNPANNSTMTIFTASPSIHLYADAALTEEVDMGTKRGGTLVVNPDHLRYELLTSQCSKVLENTTVGNTYYLVFGNAFTSAGDVQGVDVVVEFLYKDKNAPTEADEPTTQEEPASAAPVTPVEPTAQEEPSTQNEESTSQKAEEPVTQKEEPTTQKEEPTTQKAEEPTQAEPLNGVVKGPQGWGLYENDELQTGYTGIKKNQYGWWRIENGKVNFKANGVYKNEYGWWYVKDGKVDFNYTGIAKNDYGWWRIEKGKVNFKANGIFKNEHGWWKVEGGKVNFKYTGAAKNDYGWWRVEKGKVNFKANGLFSNEYGTWYVKNGKVDFKYNGTYQGKTIKNGKVVGNATKAAVNATKTTTKKQTTKATTKAAAKTSTKATTKAAAKTSTKATTKQASKASTTKKSSPTTKKATGSFPYSSASKDHKYHNGFGCRGSKRISDKNLHYFSSEAEAKSAGYSRCDACSW